jgi:hypothetical protein
MGFGCETCPSPAWDAWKREPPVLPKPTRPPAIVLSADVAEKQHILDLTQVKDAPRYDSVTSTEGDLGTHCLSTNKDASGRKICDVMHPRLRAQAKTWAEQFVLFDPAASYPMFIATLTKSRESPMGPQQLMDAGCDVNRIKALGFTASHLKAMGKTAQAMRASSWPALDMRMAGFTAESLLTGGYTAAELRMSLFTASEMKDAGCNVLQLKNGGFTLRQLKDANFDIPSLRSAGYSEFELKGEGFSALNLRAMGCTAVELKVAGFTSAELRDAGFDLHALDVAGFSVEELKNARYSEEEICQVRICYCFYNVFPLIDLLAIFVDGHDTFSLC